MEIDIGRTSLNPVPYSLQMSCGANFSENWKDYVVCLAEKEEDIFFHHIRGLVQCSL